MKSALKELPPLFPTKQSELIEYLDNAAIGMHWIDANGVIIWANQFELDMLGFKLTEYLGHKVTEFLADNNKSEEILKALLGSEPLNDYEVQLITKEGTLKHVHLSTNVYWKNNKLIHVRCFMTDISYLKALETRKDEFISIASHELKTPIATIKGFTQILENYFSKNQKANYYLEKIEDNVNRLNKLVNDLLDISRIQQGKLILNPEEIDIDTLVREAVKDLQVIETHNIILQARAGQKVFVDRYRISQVVSNLISNGIKFSPGSEKVIVKTYTEDRYVVISVQDFGIGISKSDHSKIFQPFFQGDQKKRKSFGGLGLGLHISNVMVLRHGGQFRVESEKSKGSTFSFTIPIKS